MDHLRGRLGKLKSLWNFPHKYVIRNAILFFADGFFKKLFTQFTSPRNETLLNFSSDVFHQIFLKRESSELLSGMFMVIPALKIELRHQRKIVSYYR